MTCGAVCLGVFHTDGINGIILAELRDCVEHCNRNHKENDAGSDGKFQKWDLEARNIGKIHDLITAVGQCNTDRHTPQQRTASVEQTFVCHHPVNITVSHANTAEHTKIPSSQHQIGGDGIEDIRDGNQTDQHDESDGHDPDHANQSPLIHFVRKVVINVHSVAIIFLQGIFIFIVLLHLQCHFGDSRSIHCGGCLVCRHWQNDTDIACIHIDSKRNVIDPVTQTNGSVQWFFAGVDNGCSDFLRFWIIGIKIAYGLSIFIFFMDAYFKSLSSPDSSFTLMLGMDGRIVQDYYEEHVIDRGNTVRRLEDDYRAAVGKVLDSPSFPYNNHIDYGELQFITEEYKNAAGVPTYALIANDLELDGIYDINELGAKAGKLTIYIYDDIVTTERLAEIILNIKGMFDDAGVGFYAMDCVLEYPKPESGEWKRDRVEVMEFLYADIYEDGMVERVQVSNDAAEAYYEEMDSIKKEESGK